MASLLHSLEVQTTRFDPLEAELTITAMLDDAAGCELRGRLVGPKCLYAETIEIAYPVKPLPGGDELLRARVLIPEASPWDTKTPFLYEGPVELWKHSRSVESRHVTHGIRHLVLGVNGLRLNGQLLKLHGLLCDSWSAEQAQHFHNAGGNLFLCTARSDNFDIWEGANRAGFLVLGIVSEEDEEILWDAEGRHARQTSCLGWVWPQRLLEHPQRWHHAMSLLQGPQNRLIGVKIDELPIGVLPGHVSFVMCDQRMLSELPDLNVPVLVLARRGAGLGDEIESPPNIRLLGYVLRELV